MPGTDVRRAVLTGACRLPHRLRARAPAATLAAAGAVVLSSLAGCAAPDAPRQGIILFEDPAPRAGTVGRPTAPVRIIYVALGEGEEVDPVQVAAGTAGWRPDEPGAAGPPPPRRRERVLEHPRFAKSRPRLLPGEDFAALWQALEEVGLFELPEYRSRELPAREPFFLLDDTRRRRVFVRPDDSRLEVLSQRELEQVSAWRKAKYAIFAFDAALPASVIHGLELQGLRHDQ